MELNVDLSSLHTAARQMHGGASFLFLDLETGGLNGKLTNGEMGNEYYPIFEIGYGITTPDLEIIAEPSRIVIHQAEDEIQKSSEWALGKHSKTGLLDEVRESETSLAEAEEQIIRHLKSLGINTYDREAKTGALLCGSSVHFDRSFIKAQMTKFDNYLHYRQVDISAIALVMRYWQPELEKRIKDSKEFRHEALSDIKETIAEAVIYKNFIQGLSGNMGE